MDAKTERFIKRIEANFLNVAFPKNDRLKNNNLYKKMHSYVKYKKHKKSICSICDVSGVKTEWALTHATHYTFNINDYEEMCISCHRKYDITEETREKFRNRELSKNRTFFPKYDKSKIHKVSVIAVDIGAEFESITEAASKTNASITGIANCLSGRAKSAGGHIWKRKNLKL